VLCKLLFCHKLPFEVFKAKLSARLEGFGQNGTVEGGYSRQDFVRGAALQREMNDFEIRRALSSEIDAGYSIVQEYYAAMSVVARDTREEFARLYFEEGAGIWLARLEEEVIGCIALRALVRFTDSGEVKRLYVRPEYRGRGIAVALHEALETYACNFGYRWLYLDTADNMTAAIRFYEAHGYERCARYNKNSQATIFMRKELLASVQKKENMTPPR
jgi:ribosomal protein S18 acetylase RimI-like enzyme